MRKEPRSTTLIKWSPERFNTAERLAASGDFSLAADVCQAMMSNERVSAAIDRLYASVTLPLKFKLPGVDSEKSQDDPVVQALDADWYHMFPEGVLRDLVAWIALMRCVLLHVDSWKIDPLTGRAIPVISVWSPRNLRNDPVKGLCVKVSKGNSDSVWVEEQITPGDGRWIVGFLGSDWRAILKAPWVGLCRWWLLELYAVVDWGFYSETHGQGTQVAKNLRPGDGGISLTKQARVKLANDMKAKGRGGAIVMPDGFDYALVTDSADSYQTFVKQKEVANEAYTIGITGTNLTTQVSGGSYAAASVHQSVDATKMRGLLEWLSTTSHDQVLIYWGSVNYGDTAVVPYAWWETEPPEDREARAKIFWQASLGLQNAVNAGVPVSKKWFAQTYNIGLAESEEDRIIPLPPAQAQGGGGGGGNGAAANALLTEFFALARSSRAANAFEASNQYQERLEAACCSHGAAELAPTVAATLAAVAKAKDYAEARQLIEEAYGKVAPASRLAELTESAILMAQFAGRDTVESGLKED